MQDRIKKGSTCLSLPRSAMMFLSLLPLLLQATPSAGAEALNEPIVFSISVQEGGEKKARYIRALSQWLEQEHCEARLVFSDDQPADLAFDVRQYGAENSAPQLRVTGLNANSLDSLWLVKRTRAAGGVKAIANETVGLLGEDSVIGYQAPLKMLKQHQVDQQDVQIYQANLYQGLMVLLMHGDTYAIAAPRVLAEQWLEVNNLSVVAEKANHLQAGIWVSDRRGLKTEKIQQCLVAIQKLQRTSRRDMKMKVFPEWVNEFIR